MITIEQCRGARGILGWTQQDLADASGLSKTAINNFEKRHSDIKAESQRAIRMAFESADIEFIGEHGVSKKVESVQILRGPSALNELMDDIEKSTLNTKTEILISNVDTKIASRISTQRLFRHIDFLKTHNIKQRILTTENASNILSPSDECRYLKQAVPAGHIASFIYGQKVAFELWDKSTIIVINSADAAATEAERFEHLWSQAHIPAAEKEAKNTASAS